MIIQLKVSEYNGLIQLLKHCRTVGSSVVMYNDTMVCYNILYTLIGSHHYCHNEILPIPEGYIYKIDNVNNVIVDMEVKGRKDTITVSIDKSISIDITFKDDNPTKHIVIAEYYNESYVMSTKVKYNRDDAIYEPQSDAIKLSFDPRKHFNDILGLYDIKASTTLNSTDAETILSGGLVSISVDCEDIKSVVRITKNLITHVSSSTKLADQNISIHISAIDDSYTSTIVILSTIKSYDFIDIYRFIPYEA